MTADEMRAKLKAIGLTQAKLARTMSGYGDPRSIKTIARANARMTLGESRVSGEMVVILELLAQHRAVVQEAVRRQKVSDGCEEFCRTVQEGKKPEHCSCRRTAALEMMGA